MELAKVDVMIREMEDSFQSSRPEVFMMAHSHRSRPLLFNILEEVEQKISMKTQIGKFLDDAILAVQDTIDSTKPKILPSPSANTRFSLMGRFVYLKGIFAVLSDRIGITQAFLESGNAELLKFAGSRIEQDCPTFLLRCREAMQTCHQNKCFRITNQVVLLFIKMTRVIEVYVNSTNVDLSALQSLCNEARDFLNRVDSLTKLLFKDHAIFESAIKEGFGLLAKPWHDSVSNSEVAAINSALGCEQSQVGSNQLSFCADNHPYRADAWGVGNWMEKMRCTECGK